jgi:secondary thiamine-phosphate synthase enzyme
MIKIKVNTKGRYDFIDLTERVAQIVEKSNLNSGIVSIFVKGTTAALTIMEFEEGIKKDIKNILEKIAPENADYEHHKKWQDHNGAAHIKSAIIGPSLVVPFEEKKLSLGVWQAITLIDFDEKPRERELIIKVIN